jgi:hypothetical protein
MCDHYSRDFCRRGKQRGGYAAERDSARCCSIVAEAKRHSICTFRPSTRTFRAVSERSELRLDVRIILGAIQDADAPYVVELLRPCRERPRNRRYRRVA